jgi:hypothetical protein
VVKNRGQQCGDIELTGYLANETGPVPLVLDLRITHDRVGSSSDPTVWYHLYLLFLVRQTGYIVNLSDFYSYRIIQKLTAFSHLQEFSQRKPTVASSTSAAPRSLSSLKEKLVWISVRQQSYV